MASVKYDIEVQVSRVSVSRLLSEYWNPDPVREACKLCPDYGKVWSCPPGVPEADDYLKPFREGFLIAVLTWMRNHGITIHAPILPRSS